MLIMLFIISLWVVGVVGWILNIVKIIKGLKSKDGKSTPVTTMFIARCIGVIAAPLGVILGFMNG